MLPDTRLIETTHITKGLDKLVFRPKKPSHEFINNSFQSRPTASSPFPMRSGEIMEHPKF